MCQITVCNHNAFRITGRAYGESKEQVRITIEESLQEKTRVRIGANLPDVYCKKATSDGLGVCGVKEEDSSAFALPLSVKIHSKSVGQGDAAFPFLSLEKTCVIPATFLA